MESFEKRSSIVFAVGATRAADPNAPVQGARGLQLPEHLEDPGLDALMLLDGRAPLDPPDRIRAGQGSGILDFSRVREEIKDVATLSLWPRSFGCRLCPGRNRRRRCSYLAAAEPAMDRRCGAGSRAATQTRTRA